jgi:hypothetical protein
MCKLPQIIKYQPDGRIFIPDFHKLLHSNCGKGFIEILCTVFSFDKENYSEKSIGQKIFNQRFLVCKYWPSSLNKKLWRRLLCHFFFT